MKRNTQEWAREGEYIMMISEKMKPLVANNSVIRVMFEEGKRLASIYGAENVYDFSLGNPNVPAPKEVNEAIVETLMEEESTFVHGYMSNAGYEDVRATIADSLNQRFGTAFHQNNILMTVGAASGLNVILKTIPIAYLEDDSEDPITFDSDFTFDDCDCLEAFQLPENFR